MLYLFFLSIPWLIYSSNYYLDQSNTAYVARNWNENESLTQVGYPIKTRFFEDDINTISHNKISIFSP